MKNISLIAEKATTRTTGSASSAQRTGVHCPVSGVWQDQSGGLRFVAKGALFPATAHGPSDWRLQEAEFASALP